MSEPSVAGPPPKATSRFAAFSLIFGGLALVDSVLSIVLEIQLVSVDSFSESFDAAASAVALVLVPILYVIGIVLGVIGRRRSAGSGGRVLATIGIVVNSVLLAVGLLIYSLGIVLGQYLQKTLGG
jgi:hypothetical protein